MDPPLSNLKSWPTIRMALRLKQYQWGSIPDPSGTPYANPSNAGLPALVQDPEARLALGSAPAHRGGAHRRRRDRDRRDALHRSGAPGHGAARQHAARGRCGPRFVVASGPSRAPGAAPPRGKHRFAACWWSESACSSSRSTRWRGTTPLRGPTHRLVEQPRSTSFLDVLCASLASNESLVLRPTSLRPPSSHPCHTQP